MHIELYKEAALLKDVSQHQLRVGDVGTVVEILTNPTDGSRGVVLEIFNALGESIAFVTIPETDVEPLTADEVWSVRRLASVG